MENISAARDGHWPGATPPAQAQPSRSSLAPCLFVSEQTVFFFSHNKYQHKYQHKPNFSINEQGVGMFCRRFPFCRLAVAVDVAAEQTR
jgi:hypothetical protein